MVLANPKITTLDMIRRTTWIRCMKHFWRIIRVALKSLVLTGLVDLRSSATTSQLQVGRCTAHPSKQYCVALIQNAASVIHRQLPNIRYCSVLIQNTVSAIHRQLPNNRICRALFRNAASVLHSCLTSVTAVYWSKHSFCNTQAAAQQPNLQGTVSKRSFCNTHAAA